MHADVISYINGCPWCLRRKSQQDKAPLLNIETSQALELIHLDYLKFGPSKGNIENVLVPTTQRIQVGNGQYVVVLFVIPVIIEIHGHLLKGL